MEKSFSLFEHRREVMQGKLELMLELDAALYDPAGPPYILERHEQMLRQIADAREEIDFLTEEMELAAARRQRRLAQLLPGKAGRKGKR